MIKIRWSTLLQLALFLFTASAFAQTRDYWLKMERKGTGFGYEHITIRQLKNGNLEYQIRQHQKTGIAGLIQQDIIQQCTYLVNAEFLPISFNLQTRSGTKVLTTTGKYAAGLMKLSIEEEGGNIRNKEIPFLNTFFDGTLGDLILQQEQQKIFKLNLFRPATLKIDSVQVKIINSKTNWLEAVVTNLDTKKYKINRRGQIEQIKFVELAIREYLTDAENAQKITYLNTADGLSWIVKSKRSFPNVFKIARAKIQVRWKDILVNEFNFEDNRQHVFSVTGKNEVVVEIKKTTPVSTGITAPIINNKFAPFLQDTEFIKPGDPLIQHQLTKIMGDEKDAFAIVEKILHWVSTNIQTASLTETLTAPEALKMKKGRSAEYAILFASLARAAGIPTKVVLGEANRGNQWFGHIWNEVWLGEWLAVEPGAGMFITGPSHLKFVDSHTILGMQRIRMKLIDNLSVEILDFKEEETVTATSIKTGVLGTTYSNRAFSCKISLPNEKWFIKEKTINGQISILMEPENEKNVKFALVLFAVPLGMSAENILDGQVTALSGMMKNFEQLNYGKMEIAKQQVPRIMFLQTAKDSLILINENCLLVDNTNAYLFAAVAPQKRFGEFKTAFQKIISSFKLY